MRRSARQKQRSALNLARTGSDYASLRGEDEVRQRGREGCERERLRENGGKREIARAVDGSRLNDRRHEARAALSDNSSSFAMGDGAVRIEAGNRGYWPIMSDSLLLLARSRVLLTRSYNRREQRGNAVASLFLYQRELSQK